MTGSRRFLLCSLVGLLAVLSLASVFHVAAADSPADYQEEAKSEYLGWIGRIVEKHQASTETDGPDVSSLATSNIIYITVNPEKGKGDFRKIQKAINSVPDDSSDRYVILVAPGTYKYEPLPVSFAVAKWTTPRPWRKMPVWLNATAEGCSDKL